MAVQNAVAKPGGRPATGQALLWVAVMLPLLLAVIGLAIDGAALFAARRQAQNVADAAARAGAQQIDLGVYRARDEIELDYPLARKVAIEYVSELGGFDATIDVRDRAVIVTVRRDVPLSFLKLVGVAHVAIGAAAVAEPFHGIDFGQRGP